MKKLTTILLLCLPVILSANEPITFQSIKEVKNIEVTSIEDQHQTSTCWSFSTLSMFESELLRAGKGIYDFSEMYIVRKNYERKADKYYRMRGNLFFGGGGEFNDPVEIIDEYGLMPESVYPGIRDSAGEFNHTALDSAALAYMKNVVAEKKESGEWEQGFNLLLDRYLGVCPTTFEYQGKTYNPLKFAASTGLKSSDYVVLTSFTHHPFYKAVAIEVPDNWSWGTAFNLPLDEFMTAIKYSLDNNYSLAWAADVSEKGFRWREAMATVVPSAFDSTFYAQKKTSRVADSHGETLITPALRQRAFDVFKTTDDHGMHLIGWGKMSDGRTFFTVKNSWGTDNPGNGYLYVSESYVAYKTVFLLLNKKALPETLRKKLAL